jgi:hypothetical protein
MGKTPVPLDWLDAQKQRDVGIKQILPSYSPDELRRIQILVLFGQRSRVGADLAPDFPQGFEP